MSASAGGPHRTDNRVLALLPPEEYQRLSPHLEPVALSARQVLYDAGGPIRHVYFPAAGVVSWLRSSPGRVDLLEIEPGVRNQLAPALHAIADERTELVRCAGCDLEARRRQAVAHGDAHPVAEVVLGVARHVVHPACDARRRPLPPQLLQKRPGALGLPRIERIERNENGRSSKDPRRFTSRRVVNRQSGP